LAFFERWSQQCETNGTKLRSLIGDNFIKTQQQWYEKNHNKKLNNWRSLYLPGSVFAIEYSIVVFDDTVLHYNWEGRQKFGIAIHDKTIANMQRSTFEILWKLGRSIDG
jgi:hypothetical protein